MVGYSWGFNGVRILPWLGGTRWFRFFGKHIFCILD